MHIRSRHQLWRRSSRLSLHGGSIPVALRAMASTALVAACLLLGGAARAQDAGYMRMVSSSGRQMAGESTDPAHHGWIPLRQAIMPSASEIAAIAQESKGVSAASESKSVHRPIVLVKDRDQSSLELLVAMTSHQRFPVVDIVLTKGDQVLARYKLTDATVISDRGGGTNGGTDAPMEQLRLTYAKIEIEH
jgi:type VI protein secretion system component Hcp